MLVGLLTVTIHLHGIDSLKGKRKIVKSLVVDFGAGLMRLFQKSLHRTASSWP